MTFVRLFDLRNESIKSVERGIKQWIDIEARKTSNYVFISREKY